MVKMANFTTTFFKSRSFIGLGLGILISFQSFPTLAGQQFLRLKQTNKFPSLSSQAISFVRLVIVSV